MTQEEKELLLKDLCARLPHNLYIRVEEFNVPKNEAITEGFVGNYLKDNRCNDYDVDGILNELADGCINVKPYLRPISSMTEEEFQEFRKDTNFEAREAYEVRANGENKIVILQADCDLSVKESDWLNAHHFDYRRLIEKGLALEAPERMYND